MKQKHSKVEVTCATCGKRTFKTKSDFMKNKTGNFYCGMDCLKIGFSKTLKGENNPFFGKKHTRDSLSKIKGKNHWNYGNRTAIVKKGICKGCHQEFEYRSIPSYPEHIFCSPRCKAEYGKSSRVTKPCTWCGNPVTKIAAHQKQKNFFCDADCYHKWHAENAKHLVGPDHPHFGKRGHETPNWKGGTSLEPYGEDFNSDLKLRVRRRDDFTCQLCGAKENGRKLDCHHIDYDKQNNSETNLITLCRENGCHQKTNGRRAYWTKYFQTLLTEKYGYLYYKPLRNGFRRLRT